MLTQRQIIFSKTECWIWTLALCLFYFTHLTNANTIASLEGLLPSQTIALAAVPKLDAATETFLKTPLGKLWQHPEFIKIRTAIQEKTLGDSLSQTNLFGIPMGIDIQTMAQEISSCHLAIIHTPGGTNNLLQTWDASAVLGANMGQSIILVTNIIAALNTPQTDGLLLKESINGTPMIGIPLTKAQTDKILNIIGVKPDVPNFTLTFWVSVVDSYLLIEVNDISAIKMIIKTKAGNTPNLAQEPEWIKHKERFTDGIFWGWANLSPIVQKWIENESEEIETITLSSSEKTQEKTIASSTNSVTNLNNPPEEEFSLMPRVIEKMGLESFLSASVCVLDMPVGICTDYYISSPENARQGIAKLLTAEAGDCTPPAFIHQDILRFSRMHINISYAWDTICKLVDSIMPDVRDLLLTSMLPGIQEQIPDFDFRKDFVEPLGHDIIFCEKNSNQNEKNTIRFVKISDGEKYIGSVKKLIALLAPIPSLERKVDKYKITSIPIPDLDLNVAEVKTNYCHFTYRDGYLAFSTSQELISQFLSTAQDTNRLTACPGLEISAQAIGGFSTGFFEYNNSKEIARICYNHLRNVSDEQREQPLLFPLFSILSQDFTVNLAFIKKIIPPASMPDFETFADCFQYSVSIYQSTADGFTIRTILPSEATLGNQEEKQIEEDKTITLPTAEKETKETTIETNEELIIPRPQPIAPVPPSTDQLPEKAPAQKGTNSLSTAQTL